MKVLLEGVKKKGREADGGSKKRYGEGNKYRLAPRQRSGSCGGRERWIEGNKKNAIWII